MNEWISVKDRLPDPRGGDGVFRHDSIPVLCVVMSKVTVGSRMEVGTYCSYFATGWKEFERDEYRGTSVVTHWMPLPELPTR